MGCLGRATCTVQLISAPDQPGRKIMYCYIREAKSLLSYLYTYTVASLLKLTTTTKRGDWLICNHLCFLQGVCTVRDLRNISLVEERVREPVVANNATASTVAFIAPGPPNPPITQVMYVGVTWTGNGPYRSEVPAASSRSLDSGTLFQIAGM